MPTVLMDAPQYDAAKIRRRNVRIAQILGAILLIAAVVWWFRYWPEEHAVDKFLTACEQQQYEKAYGIWMADADWQKHPEKYSRYKFDDFHHDWAGGGELGLIRSHSIDGSARPKNSKTGVVVIATVNQRNEKAHIFVDFSDKSLSFWRDFLY